MIDLLKDSAVTLGVFLAGCLFSLYLFPDYKTVVVMVYGVGAMFVVGVFIIGTAVYIYRKEMKRARRKRKAHALWQESGEWYSQKAQEELYSDFGKIRKPRRQVRG